MVKWVPMFRTHFSQQTADTKQQTATFTQCFIVEISVFLKPLNHEKWDFTIDILEAFGSGH